MKPAHEGSTHGPHEVLAAASSARVRARREVRPAGVAEEFVEGQELTASILGEEALPLIRIEAPQGNYD